MEFELSEHKELRGIPSASGLEITAHGIYVIGDDSPYLFHLNSEYEIIERIPLFPDRNLPTQIIGKMEKPDLEALTKGNDSGRKLLAFGSGSKSPERDVVMEIDISARITAEYNLTEFYTHIKKIARLKDDQLNIEAAQVYKDQLFLFNRGENLIIKCRLSRFMGYIKENMAIPPIEIYRILLPEIDGLSAGFSGASLDPEHGILFFTSTVENTNNWIDDGEVLGSFIGTIDLKDLKDGMKPDNIAILYYENYLKVKVESIAVLPPYKTDNANLILVTDSDGGVSEILTGILYFHQ